MRKRYIVGFILFAAVIVIFSLLDRIEPAFDIKGNTDLIAIHSLEPGDFISSPLEIRGIARGYWFFEADFPVYLLDEKMNRIAWAVARAEEDWMTEEFVPFTVTIDFKKPRSEIGYIRFEKDNPSDLPEHSDYQLFPVRFLQ